MTAQYGRDVLMKVDISGAGEFQTVAGLRATKIAFNAGSVNTTHMQSEGQWRELLKGGGVKSASLTGSGVFVDSLSDAAIRHALFAGEPLKTQLILPDFGTIESLFQVTALEYSGDYEGEMQFDIALLSAAAVHFIPETSPAI